MAVMKHLSQRSMPAYLKKAFGYYFELVADWKTQLQLARFRRKVLDQKLGSLARFQNYIFTITDGPNFYMQYKDEFIRRIYHFDAARPDPLIIDGGSNIGMSILYFKHIYPQARIMAFEPDPTIFRMLEENVVRNKLNDVKLLNVGLGAQTGVMTFTPDGSAGGHIGIGKNSIEVEINRLSDYLNEPVDFLKLNIEGEELLVLREVAASGKLTHLKEMVIEYHGWSSSEQCLGDILNLLDHHGFRYLVHDFDAETCPVSKPPFHLTQQTAWFCLVYARRLDN